MWLVRKREGEHVQCLSNSPAWEAQEGQAELCRAFWQGQDEGDDRAMKCVNRSMGGTSMKAPHGQDLLLHPPG